MKKYTLLSLSFTLAVCLGVNAQTINTFAGNGTAGFSGDGGPATAAKLNIPQAIAVDASGNVFFSDLSNNRIRKVNTSGIISTFAGNGTAGFAGDGGPATAAEFNMSVYGIACDGSGNVYFANNTDNRVRVVNTAGIINTMAGNGTFGFSGDGGPATAAELNAPFGVAVDASGNVYIADMLNYRVRMVNTAGIISTFAGNGFPATSGDGGPATAASIYKPRSLTFDGSGNLYIYEDGGPNNVIRKVNTSGVISTYAGCCGGGYSGDGGPATAAQMTNVWGLAFDGSGNLYNSAQGNNRVRVINSAGTINAFAGTGVSGYGGDGGPATAALLNSPWGVATDGSGNLYIADGGNNRIRKVMGITSGVAPITGTTSVCVASTTPLSDATPGGTWTSSATGIAAVGSSSGIVSGVAAGTATITYTVGASYATTTVTVVAGPPVVVITASATSVCVGHTITLNGTPAGGTWTSLTTSIATVGSSTGLVTGVTTGTAPIVYSVSNACGTGTNTLNVTVTSGGPCTTNVKEEELSPYNDPGLSVYPNPNNGTFTFLVSTEEDEKVQVVITNIMGQKVKELTMNSNEAKYMILDQPPGIYFIAARSGSQTFFAKVTVQ